MKTFKFDSFSGTLFLSIILLVRILPYVLLHQLNADSDNIMSSKEFRLVTGLIIMVINFFVLLFYDRSYRRIAIITNNWNIHDVAYMFLAFLYLKRFIHLLLIDISTGIIFALRRWCCCHQFRYRICRRKKRFIPKILHAFHQQQKLALTQQMNLGKAGLKIDTLSYQSTKKLCKNHLKVSNEPSSILSDLKNASLGSLHRGWLTNTKSFNFCQ